MEKSCSNCGEPIPRTGAAKGYCRKCYRRWRIYGDPNFVPPRRLRASCSECDKPAASHGYCHRHWRRVRLYGDPSIVLRTGNNGSQRRYTLDREYFDRIDTPEKAYWLGFLTADGGVTGDDVHGWCLGLELAEYDAGHLIKFARAMSTDAPVRASRQNCVRIRLNSNRLARSLAVLGVTPRKSLVAEPPMEKLAGLERHYWRGLWDGDGHISKRAGRIKWNIGIVGSRACVDGFATWAREISGSTATPGDRHPASPMCRQWGVTGTRKAQLLAEELRLAGCGFGLDRKQALLEELCSFDFGKHEADVAARRLIQFQEARMLRRS